MLSKYRSSICKNCNSSKVQFMVDTEISEADNGWQKISSTLENDSKIYSYRVDAIHSIAYKMMNTMARNQDDENE